MTPEERRIKRNAYLVAWREKNRDKTRAAQQRYYNANKEVCDARVRSCHEKNRAYYSEKSVEWVRANRERHLETKRRSYTKNSATEIARVRRRQGRIKHGEMLMTQAELAEVQGMYDFCRIFKSFEVDHIIPLNGKNVSGLHTLKNLQVLTKFANRSKGNKAPELNTAQGAIDGKQI
jgi:hypothetical protein